MTRAVESRTRGCRVALLATALACSAATLRAEELQPACPKVGSVEFARTDRDVVLLAVDRELACALRVALEPWGIRVLESSLPSPGPSMPGTALRARSFALEHAAAAVVWLSRDGDAYALWVYDAANDRTLARPAPPPPLAPARAAALALSIKTLLRLTPVAPESARASTWPEPRATETTTDAANGPPVPAARVPAQPASERDGLEQRGPASALQAGLSVALRSGSPGVAAAPPRAALELRWAPSGFAATGPAHPWLGAAIESGLARRVDSGSFAGHALDPALRLGAGVRAPVAAGCALALSGDADLHWSKVWGEASSPDGAVSADRLDLAFSLRPELEADLAAAWLVFLQPSAALWVRRQRFTVHDAPVFETPRISVQLALGVAVR
jgi:hypothetical protein